MNVEIQSLAGSDILYAAMKGHIEWYRYWYRHICKNRTGAVDTNESQDQIGLYTVDAA